jgi:HPt (histidine-containing phosphotransfer) domain-containing protein
MKDEFDRCLAGGCDWYISKPVQMADLIRTIAEQAPEIQPESKANLFDCEQGDATMDSHENQFRSSESPDDGILLSSLPRDNSTYQRLVPFFVDRIRENVENLRQYLGQSDWISIRNLAHQLKGAGGGYGFQVVTDIAGKLESVVEKTPVDIPQVASAIDQLDIVARQAKDGLKYW